MWFIVLSLCAGHDLRLGRDIYPRFFPFNGEIANNWDIRETKLRGFITMFGVWADTIW